ncbi:hypothetical protein SLA2020_108700 [Shorea laevis]
MGHPVRIAGCGVGVRVKEERRAGEVQKSLKEVMEGKRSKEIKKNSSKWKWKELAQKAISEGRSSHDCINGCVEHLITFEFNGLKRTFPLNHEGWEQKVMGIEK